MKPPQRSSFKRELETAPREFRDLTEAAQGAADRAEKIGDNVIAALRLIDVALRDLKRRITKLEERADANTELLGDLKSSLEVQGQSSEKTGRTVGQIRVRLDGVVQQMVSLDDQLLQLRQTLKKLQEEVDRTVSHVIDGRLASIQDQVTSHAEFLASIEATYADLSKLRATVDLLDLSTRAREWRLSSTIEQRIAALTDQLPPLRQMLDMLREEIDRTGPQVVDGLALIQEQVTSHTERLAPIEAGYAVLSELVPTVDLLDLSTRALEWRLSSTIEQRIAALTDQLPQLRQMLDKLGEEIDRAGPQVVDGLALIQEQVTSHTKRLAPIEAGYADLSELRATVDLSTRALESRLSSTIEQRIAALTDQLPPLRQMLDKLREEIDRTGPQVVDGLALIQEQVTSHAERLAPMEAKYADLSKLKSSIDCLDQRMGSLEQRLTPTGPILPVVTPSPEGVKEMGSLEQRLTPTGPILPVHGEFTNHRINGSVRAVFCEIPAWCYRRYP